MTSHKDEIIREQADVIEDLQEELMQVYAELYEKEKRRAKRTPESDDDSGDVKSGRIPVFLKVVWWHFFQPDQLDEFKRANKQSDKYHASWQLTAFLIYFPMLFGVIGFILGAVPAKIDFPVRFGVGLNLLVVVGLASLATAELKRYKDVARSNLAALTSSVVVVFVICLLTLRMDNSPGVNWLLVMVGLVYIPNSGVRRQIMNRLDLPQPHARETYDYPLWIASGIILEASIISAAVKGDSFNFITLMVLSSPFMAIGWIIILHFASQPFAIGFQWVEGRYRTDLILRGITQSVILLILAVLYGGLIVLALFGSQIYGP